MSDPSGAYGLSCAAATRPGRPSNRVRRLAASARTSDVRPHRWARWTRGSDRPRERPHDEVQLQPDVRGAPSQRPRRRRRPGRGAGVDFLTISDHFHPWLYSHEHSPYAWSVLGALAATTHDVRLVSLVTCPFLRYHPAIVAQKAATVAAIGAGAASTWASAQARTSTSTSWAAAGRPSASATRCSPSPSRSSRGSGRAGTTRSTRPTSASTTRASSHCPTPRRRCLAAGAGSRSSWLTHVDSGSATAHVLRLGERHQAALAHRPSTRAAATGGARGSDPAPRPGTR